jgi:hypothetical protein
MKTIIINTLRFIAAPIIAIIISGLIIWAYSWIGGLPYLFSKFWFVVYLIFALPVVKAICGFLGTILAMVNAYITGGIKWVGILPVLIYVIAGLLCLYSCTYGYYITAKEAGCSYGLKDVIVAGINIAILLPIFYTLAMTSFIDMKEEY